MHPPLPEVSEGRFVVTDGAWTTQLREKGLSPSVRAASWNVQKPEIVEELARAYVEAGSGILLTNTFDANFERAGAAIPEKSVRDWNVAGVRIARAAAAGKALVYGSVGPTGRSLLGGELPIRRAREVFLQQIRSLAEAGVDGFVVETMSDLSEARMAVEVAHATGLPVVGCMLFDSGPAPDRTMYGTSAFQAARGLVESGASAVGANCGHGLARMLPVVQELRRATRVPLWIKATAEVVPQVVAPGGKERTEREVFERAVELLVDRGVSFLGGCCGTGPAFVRQLAEVAQRLPAGVASGARPVLV